MAWFINLYRWLEKNIFSSLTRKLVGNFCALILLQVVFAIGFYSFSDKLKEVGEGKFQGEHLLWTVRVLQDQMELAVIVFSFGSVLCMVLAFSFLRHLMVRPIHQLNSQLEKMAKEDADLSKQLKASSFDEFAELAQNYNQFLGRLAHTISTIRQMGMEIAVGSAQVVNGVDDSAAKAGRQGELAEVIFTTSDSVTRSIDSISGNTQTISSSTDQCLGSARESYKSLEELNRDISKMQGQISSHDTTIKQMGEKSRDIAKIINTIQEISFQTGLLALNAAVEAARAGEAGRGFSVVAGEVKKLAEQASRSSEDISDQLNAVLGMIETATDEAANISRFASETSQVADSSCRSFQGMIGEFEQNSQRLTEITQSVQGVSQSNGAMHENVNEIRDLGHDVGQLMEQSRGVSRELQQSTEKLQQLVAYFKTGEGIFETVLAQAQQFRDQAAQRIRSLAARGAEVFDTRYQQVPGTDPPKYQNSYDRFFDEDFRRFYDQVAEQVPGGTFAICVDSNGYCPTHNSRYSQALSGDHEYDLAHSRDKRIYNDPTGLRSARNQEPFLLQTYMRDTGEILSDLSMPILINGRHWGAIRIGFDSKVLLQ